MWMRCNASSLFLLVGVVPNLWSGRWRLARAAPGSAAPCPRPRRRCRRAGRPRLWGVRAAWWRGPRAVGRAWGVPRRRVARGGGVWPTSSPRAAWRPAAAGPPARPPCVGGVRRRLGCASGASPRNALLARPCFAPCAVASRPVSIRGVLALFGLDCRVVGHSRLPRSLPSPHCETTRRVISSQ